MFCPECNSPLEISFIFIDRYRCFNAHCPFTWIFVNEKGAISGKEIDRKDKTKVNYAET